MSTSIPSSLSSTPPTTTTTTTAGTSDGSVSHMDPLFGDDGGTVHMDTSVCEVARFREACDDGIMDERLRLIMETPPPIINIAAAANPQQSDDGCSESMQSSIGKSSVLATHDDNGRVPNASLMIPSVNTSMGGIPSYSDGGFGTQQNAPAPSNAPATVDTPLVEHEYKQIVMESNLTQSFVVGHIGNSPVQLKGGVASLYKDEGISHDEARKWVIAQFKNKYNAELETKTLSSRLKYLFDKQSWENPKFVITLAQSARSIWVLFSVACYRLYVKYKDNLSKKALVDANLMDDNFTPYSWAVLGATLLVRSDLMDKIIKMGIPARYFSNLRYPSIRSNSPFTPATIEHVINCIRFCVWNEGTHIDRITMTRLDHLRKGDNLRQATTQSVTSTAQSLYDQLTKRAILLRESGGEAASVSLDTLIHQEYDFSFPLQQAVALQCGGLKLFTHWLNPRNLPGLQPSELNDSKVVGVGDDGDAKIEHHPGWTDGVPPDFNSLFKDDVVVEEHVSFSRLTKKFELIGDTKYAAKYLMDRSITTQYDIQTAATSRLSGNDDIMNKWRSVVQTTKEVRTFKKFTRRTSTDRATVFHLYAYYLTQLQTTSATTIRSSSSGSSSKKVKAVEESAHASLVTLQRQVHRRLRELNIISTGVDDPEFDQSFYLVPDRHQPHVYKAYRDLMVKNHIAAEEITNYHFDLIYSTGVMIDKSGQLPLQVFMDSQLTHQIAKQLSIILGIRMCWWLFGRCFGGKEEDLLEIVTPPSLALDDDEKKEEKKEEKSSPTTSITTYTLAGIKNEKKPLFSPTDLVVVSSDVDQLVEIMEITPPPAHLTRQAAAIQAAPVVSSSSGDEDSDDDDDESGAVSKSPAAAPLGRKRGRPKSKRKKKAAGAAAAKPKKKGSRRQKKKEKKDNEREPSGPDEEKKDGNEMKSGDDTNVASTHDAQAPFMTFVDAIKFTKSSTNTQGGGLTYDAPNHISTLEQVVELQKKIASGKADAQVFILRQYYDAPELQQQRDVLAEEQKGLRDKVFVRGEDDPAAKADTGMDTIQSFASSKYICDVPSASMCASLQSVLPTYIKRLKLAKITDSITNEEQALAYLTTPKVYAGHDDDAKRGDSGGTSAEKKLKQINIEYNDASIIITPVHTIANERRLRAAYHKITGMIFEPANVTGAEGLLDHLKPLIAAGVQFRWYIQLPGDLIDFYRSPIHLLIKPIGLVASAANYLSSCDILHIAEYLDRLKHYFESIPPSAQYNILAPPCNNDTLGTKSKWFMTGFIHSVTQSSFVPTMMLMAGRYYIESKSKAPLPHHIMTYLKDHTDEVNVLQQHSANQTKPNHWKQLLDILISQDPLLDRASAIHDLKFVEHPSRFERWNHQDYKLLEKAYETYCVSKHLKASIRAGDIDQERVLVRLPCLSSVMSQFHMCQVDTSTKGPQYLLHSTDDDNGDTKENRTREAKDLQNLYHRCSVPIKEIIDSCIAAVGGAGASDIDVMTLFDSFDSIVARIAGGLLRHDYNRENRPGVHGMTSGVSGPVKHKQFCAEVKHLQKKRRANTIMYHVIRGHTESWLAGSINVNFGIDMSIIKLQHNIINNIKDDDHEKKKKDDEKKKKDDDSNAFVPNFPMTIGHYDIKNNTVEIRWKTLGKKVVMKAIPISMFPPILNDSRWLESNVVNLPHPILRWRKLPKHMDLSGLNKPQEYELNEEHWELKRTQCKWIDDNLSLTPKGIDLMYAHQTAIQHFWYTAAERSQDPTKGRIHLQKIYGDGSCGARAIAYSLGWTHQSPYDDRAVRDAEFEQFQLHLHNCVRSRLALKEVDMEPALSVTDLDFANDVTVVTSPIVRERLWAEGLIDNVENVDRHHTSAAQIHRLLNLGVTTTQSDRQREWLDEDDLIRISCALHTDLAVATSTSLTIESHPDDSTALTHTNGLPNKKGKYEKLPGALYKCRIAVLLNDGKHFDLSLPINISNGTERADTASRGSTSTLADCEAVFETRWDGYFRSGRIPAANGYDAIINSVRSSALINIEQLRDKIIAMVERWNTDDAFRRACSVRLKLPAEQVATLIQSLATKTTKEWPPLDKHIISLISLLLTERLWRFCVYYTKGDHDQPQQNVIIELYESIAIGRAAGRLARERHGNRLYFTIQQLYCLLPTLQWQCNEPIIVWDSRTDQYSAYVPDEVGTGKEWLDVKEIPVGDMRASTFNYDFFQEVWNKYNNNNAIHIRQDIQGQVKVHVVNNDEYKENKKPPADTIWFYERDEPYYAFTNVYYDPEGQPLMFLDDQWWYTSEAYYQANKFRKTAPELYSQIAAMKTGREAAVFANKHNDKTDPLWHTRNTVDKKKDKDNGDEKEGDDDDAAWPKKDYVMYKAVHAKFTQNPKFGKYLMKTGTMELVEHTDNDGYWGDAPDENGNPGENRLGAILAYVRTELLQRGT